MNLSWKNIYSTKRSKDFFSPKVEKTPSRVRSLRSQRKNLFLKDESRRTLIDNRSISHSFNSSILSMNMRAYSYKRAESELRQILKKPNSPKANIKLNKIVRSFSRTSKLNEVSKYSKTDSSLSPKEASLIYEEYRSIKKPKVWNSILSNCKANPKQLMDLIPISLSKKQDPSKSKKIQTNLKKLKSFKLEVEKLEKIRNPSKLSSLKPSTPEFVETLKNKAERLTDDWSKSLLHYNIKHQITLDESKKFSEENLKIILKKLPSDEIELSKIHQKCLDTLEGLLMELLGTSQDFLKFKNAYNVVLPSVIKTLINNCLNLYEIKKATANILLSVIERESRIRDLACASKEDIIAIHELSKSIRQKIENWICYENVPFKKFVYKGQDYLIKMNEDLVMLQSELYKKLH